MGSISGFLGHLLAPETGSLGFAQALTAMAVAYFGGVLSSLTPCVYPMIPITVSVVGGITPETRSARRWHEVWLRGGAYVGGMAVTYSFLGVLAGLTGRVFGSFTNTSGWYLALGLILTFSALIMLDVVPFDPVASWERIKRRFGKPPAVPQVTARAEMTLIGAFTLGASSGFIAAPCTTPVLTSILAYIARTQSIGLGLGLMLSFSLGLGTLLLLVAIFAGALQILPRSGKWLKSVKVASGVLLLAFAEYLIYRAGNLGGFQ